jgi:hypothetical protein
MLEAAFAAFMNSGCAATSTLEIAHARARYNLARIAIKRRTANPWFKRGTTARGCSGSAKAYRRGGP